MKKMVRKRQPKRTKTNAEERRTNRKMPLHKLQHFWSKMRTSNLMWLVLFQIFQCQLHLLKLHPALNQPKLRTKVRLQPLLPCLTWTRQILYLRPAKQILPPKSLQLLSQRETKTILQQSLSKKRLRRKKQLISKNLKAPKLRLKIKRNVKHLSTLPSSPHKLRLI